jgi:hypothetical protein
LRESLSFGSGDPLKTDPFSLDPELIQQICQERETTLGPVVAFRIMAVSRMTTRNQNSVRPFGKRLEDEGRVDPTGTHHPDRSEIRWVLEAAGSRQVSPGVSTPSAKESNQPGFERLSQHGSPFSGGDECAVDLRENLGILKVLLASCTGWATGYARSAAFAELSNHFRNPLLFIEFDGGIWAIPDAELAAGATLFVDAGADRL